MNKKLTITELIDKKEQYVLKQDVKKELYLEQLDATLTIIKPERELVIDTIEKGSDENFDGNSDEFFVYNIVVEPNLKDPELQKAYGCVDPTEIVSKIFDVGTVAGIAQAGMDLAGFSSKVEAVKNLKN
ncbi:phage tail assembly chaperone [Viridibacillus arvi]|uniref:phage tail assembly chaperone n=1 Tax=Viridibacillus arvi TaxID=263475 RepID=UPI003CFEB8C7